MWLEGLCVSRATARFEDPGRWLETDPHSAATQ